MSPTRLLVVCTANICRSPYVEFRLRAALAARGERAVAIESAGTHALIGEPMAPESTALLEAAGISTDPRFRARQLTASMVEGSDVIIAMTREHRSRILELAPAALRRTLTLREFAGLLAAAPRLSMSDTTAPWAAAARHAIAQRSADPTLVNTARADLADPYGRGTEAFARMADEVDADLRILFERIPSSS